MQLFQLSEPGSSQNELKTAILNDPIIGIDLGTTNSLVAYVTDKVTLFKDESGRDIIPSAVAYNPDSVSVGHFSHNVFTSTKRFMGKAFVAGANYPYPTASNTQSLQFQTLQGAKSPTEMASEILKHLKKMAETELKQEVKRAVVTVPAYFDEAARQATKDAANLAGLEVARLLSEPTAAAIAYGFDQSHEGIYAVYDLGGGTFDVSILRMEMGVLQVIATCGNTQLGGDDFDLLLYNIFKTQAPALPELHTILPEIRAIKAHLSSHDEWSGTIGSIPLKASQNEFNIQIMPLVHETLNILSSAMQDARIEFKDLQAIILVGGATRTPIISEEIMKFTGIKPHNSLDPDKAVAIGAALQARNLQGSNGSLLIDVTPLSLKLELADNLTETLIPRNSPIPARREHNFTTGQNNQTGFIFNVLQGESEKANLCRLLASFELRIPPLPKGVVKVKVTFQIDADGILTVSAHETATGQAQQVMVKPSYGLDHTLVQKLFKNK